MTISAVVPVITFVGSSGAGTLGPFSLVKSGTPITFKTNSHIKVRRYSSINDTAPTLLVEDTDYTLTGGPSAGVVTLTSPQTGLLETEYLRVSREEPKTQDIAFSTGANFSSSAVESVSDGHTRQIQEVSGDVGQSLRFDFLTGDALPSLGPFEAAIGKIAYFSGSTGSPSVSYIDAASISGVVSISSEISALALQTDEISALFDIRNDISEVADNTAEIGIVSEIVDDIAALVGQLTAQPQLLVGAGQSNMESSNAQSAGGDLTPDNQVFLWDHAEREWVVWTPADGYRGRISGTVRFTNNVLFQTAKYRRKRTGQPQYNILNALAGQSVDVFVPATAALYVDLQTQVTAALASPEMVNLGKTDIDRFFYFQGEADSGMTDYGAQVDALITQLNAETWFPSGLPIIGFELSPIFVQSDYWANAPSDRNPQTYSVATQDLDYGDDSIHLVGTSMDVLGVRAGELSMGGLGGTPVDENIIAPREGSVGKTFDIGTGETFPTCDDAFKFLSSKWLRDLDGVTLRLAAGAHAAFDTSNFTGGFPLEIRGFSGAAVSFPTAADLAGGAVSARTEIETQWDSWIDCASGDGQGVKLVGDNITLRGLAIFANGEDIDIGLDVYGSAEIFSCAVHGFTRDQVFIRNGADVAYSQVVHYGGQVGQRIHGAAYSANFDTRNNVYVAQTVIPMALDDGAVTGSMCGMDVAGFTGSWPINAERSAKAYIHHLTTDTVKALVNANTGANVYIGSVSCAGISHGATPANEPETIRISGGAVLSIGAGFTIPSSNGRLIGNFGGRLRINGDVTVSAWTGTSIEFMRSQNVGAEVLITGALTITADTDGAADAIINTAGGTIIVGSLSLPVGTSITVGDYFNSPLGDAARIPAALFQVTLVLSGLIADVTAGEETQITEGRYVIDTAGDLWIYSGTGDKTLEASYTQVAAVAPEWAAILNKPDLATAAEMTAVEGDIAALDTRTNKLDFGVRTGEFFPLEASAPDTTVYPLAETEVSGWSDFGLMGASETEIVSQGGGLLFARWSDGSSSEIGNLSYPTAGTTLFEGFLQTEIVCPWVDEATQTAARWQLTWDEFSHRTSNAITRVGKDLYAWQGNGQPVLLRLEDGAARSSENGSWADFTLIDGQSLATNRTGPSRNSSTETWGTVLRFSANPDSKIKMLGDAIQGAANATEGTDTNLENIATATIADAIATPVGSSVDINDGNPLQAESAFMVNAMAQTLSEVGTRDGRWNVLNALAMGGQEITHFLQTSSGGQNDYWVGAWVPYIERLGAIVGKTPKNFSNFFIQGTKDHEDDMDEATYRGYLDDLYTDRKGVVETNLSGVTYRMIQPQVHKIYSTSATPPAGYSSYQASAIGAAQLNKGLSDDAGDAAYYTAGAFYNITFSGISHPTDNGYLMLQSMLGFVAADIKRYEDGGGNEKWKPPHVTSAVLASDNLSMTVTIHATPFLGPIEVLVPSDPSPTKGLPKKDGWGFNAYGGTAPDIDAIEVLNEDQVKITFDAAWTGTGRSLGVAWESPAAGRTFLSYYPGWQSSDGDPLGTGDTWVHNGVGSNIMRRTHWRNIVTGEPIHAYLPSQLIDIAD